MSGFPPPGPWAGFVALRVCEAPLAAAAGAGVAAPAAAAGGAAVAPLGGAAPPPPPEVGGDPVVPPHAAMIDMPARPPPRSPARLRNSRRWRFGLPLPAESFEDLSP